jgi:hypothetical protein
MSISFFLLSDIFPPRIFEFLGRITDLTEVLYPSPETSVSTGWYIAGENYWYILGENCWYIIGRKLTERLSKLFLLCKQAVLTEEAA